MTLHEHCRDVSWSVVVLDPLGKANVMGAMSILFRASKGQAYPLTCVKSACADMVQAMPDLMPGFDKEIARMAQRLLINPRSIDWHTNVFATKVIPGAPD